jgi:hypothetical protein
VAEQKESKAVAQGGGSGDDVIQYIDMGDYTLEIDNRGPVQQRRKLPKSTRGIGVAAATRRELEARIQQEVIEPQKVWEEAQSRGEDSLPPEEDDEAAAKREKTAGEALAKADQAAAEES